jgi:hypothetical protein
MATLMTETRIMNRSNIRRLAVLAFLAVIALGSLGCTATVGVGVGVPVYGGYGGYGGYGRPYGGGYYGRPMWP